MKRSEIESLAHDGEAMRLFQEEYVIAQVTERICELMEQKNVSRSDLAKRLKTSKGYVTQLLDGRANMTLRTMAKVLATLGYAAQVQTCELHATVRPTMSMIKEAQWARHSKPLRIVNSILDTTNRLAEVA